MHEFELINKYFSKLSKNNKGSLRLNDDVFFDKSKNLIISIDTYIQGTHFIDFKKPDLTALKNACITIGKALRIKFQNAIKTKNRKVPVIIFESTVYPGTTEEICIPIIKKELNNSLIFEKKQESYDKSFITEVNTFKEILELI